MCVELVHPERRVTVAHLSPRHHAQQALSVGQRLHLRRVVLHRAHVFRLIQFRCSLVPAASRAVGVERALGNQDLPLAVDDVESNELSRLGRVSPLHAVSHELVVFHVLQVGLGHPLVPVYVAVVLKVLVDALESLSRNLYRR